MTNFRFLFCTVFLATAAYLTSNSLAAGKPLKIYILAGQSNMQGHAEVRTLAHLGMDPATAPMLKDLQKADGTPRVCENVWISSIGHDGTNDEKRGKLTVGFGAVGRAPKIGPELMFGVTIAKQSDNPVLIIKTAWGGKSLHTDFRPPSAGPYQFNEQQIENFQRQGKTLTLMQEQKEAETGKYYRLMIEHVQRVLADPQRVCPAYDSTAGYELSGFVWFQGWNDMVDQGTYPNRSQPGGYAEYTDLLSHFIRDVRDDLSTPALPFVIGVMGVGGPVEKYGPDQQRYKSTHQEFRQAMAAPAMRPEFAGTVTAVMTEKQWDPQLSELARRWDKVQSKNRELNRDQSLSKAQREQALEDYKRELFSPEELQIWQTGTSNAAYHYLGSAKILCGIGKAFAEAIGELEQDREATP